MQQKIIDEIINGNEENVALLLKNQDQYFDINELFLETKASYIHYAALHGWLKIIELLITHNANWATTENLPTTNLFYWMLLCSDQNKRQVMFEWLHENSRYEKLKCGLTKEHIDVLVGNSSHVKEWAEIPDDLGLTPLHYYLLFKANFTNSLIDFKPFDINTPLINTGVLKDFSLVLLSAIFNRWDLLKTFLKAGLITDVNVKVKNENFIIPKGTTIAWTIVARGNLDLFDSLIDSGLTIDVNAKPESEWSYDKGITLAWLLVTHGRYDILRRSIDSGISIDVNAKPEHVKHYLRGITLALLLLRTPEYDLIMKLLESGHITIDANATPENENDLDFGHTFALGLVCTKQFDLLYKLIKSGANIDANALYDITKKSENTGITLAWLLAYFKEWALFDSLIDSFSKCALGTPLDANAKPVDERNIMQGITIAWLLVAEGQWESFEKLLALDTFIDLNAEPQNKEYNTNQKGTVAEILLVQKKYNYLQKILTDKPHQLKIDIINNGPSLLNQLLEDKQERLALTILNNSIHKVPVENLPAIAKLCAGCGSIKLIREFLTKYNDNEIDNLYKHWEIDGISYLISIDAIDMAAANYNTARQAMVDLSNKKCQQEIMQAFQCYYQLVEQFQNRDDLTLKIIGILDFLADYYKASPDIVQKFLAENQTVLNFTYSSKVHSNSPKLLSLTEQITFEKLHLLPQDSAEYDLVLIEAVKNKTKTITDSSNASNKQSFTLFSALKTSGEPIDYQVTSKDKKNVI